MEKFMDQFYRGERLEKTIDRSNEQIRAYNTRALAKQAETEKERSQLEVLLTPLEEARKQLKALDDELKQAMTTTSQEAIKHKVDARNALAHQINEQSAKARQATETYNALARKTQQELDQHRKQVMDAQAEVNARLASFTAFTKSGQDVAFFLDLNHLLAEIRHGLRKTPEDVSLQALLIRVRELRRELATWAIVGQSLKSNGLVIVEARLEDEPCWFIVDTGAMDTIVSEELLDAIGQGANLGKVTSLSVVGGTRVMGIACRISSLQVADQTMQDVAASAVRPSDVGIDGLLGQSFLKGFVYTIDERDPKKLILTRR
jgi:hypothetical protein